MQGNLEHSRTFYSSCTLKRPELMKDLDDATDSKNEPWKDPEEVSLEPDEYKGQTKEMFELKTYLGVCGKI